MGSKGMDFKHKEVINITDGKRLGFVQDVTADLESRYNHIYYCASVILNYLICFLLIMILSYHGRILNVLVMM